jgi:hypothetical protein
MTHLTREELQRWWRDGAPGERDRILAHLAECDECGALYGEVIDAEPVQPDADDVRVAAPRGYRAYRRPRRILGVDWSRPRVLAACGVAAVVVLAAIVPAILDPSGRSEPDGGGIRGTSLQPLAPIGTIVAPVQFRWVSPVNAARYVVEVREEGGEQILFAIASATESVDLSQEQLDRLTPGRAYSWIVIAADQAGGEIMRAPPRSFVVSSEGR